MKVVRLPSGPLACVYSLDEGASEESLPPQSSGTFRAHSGSLHADGTSEDEALAVLDEQVRRVTIPPSDEGELPSNANGQDQSPWAKRVRKCGPSDPAQASSEAETPCEGVAVPAPYSAPKANDR